MTTVQLLQWTDADLPLLRLGNTPEMTEHLGGPEDPDALERRHARVLEMQQTGEARMFRIDADGEPAGSIGWWTSEWDGRAVYETGWFTLPEFQGRGIASRAIELLIADARADAQYDLLVAFPSVTNPPSNALCARAGFERVGEKDFPFRGTVLRVAAWVLPLR
jgi:RimJ/RimL family protein N-acetyltransferase